MGYCQRTVIGNPPTGYLHCWLSRSLRWPKRKQESKPPGPGASARCCPDLGSFPSRVPVLPRDPIGALQIQSKACAWFPGLFVTVPGASLSLSKQLGADRPSFDATQETFRGRFFPAGSSVPGSGWGPGPREAGCVGKAANARGVLLNSRWCQAIRKWL